MNTHELGKGTVQVPGAFAQASLTGRLGLLAGMALFGFVVAVCITWARGWPPIPNVHDETSYVLAADTFIRGRLSNPSPPFAEHFETFHVLVRPSYASKYPPAQGMMLAVGQGLAGAPIVGVWLSAGILCAALTWMLLSWFPRRWAALGGLLIILLLAGSGGLNGYWMSTYWGGTVAATGAALVYGSMYRLRRAPSAFIAVLFAFGLGILALSRPFEGGLIALPVLVAAAFWLLRDVSTTLSWRLRTVAAPFALVMAAIGAFSLVYNHRVTGNALRLPYVEYERQYSNVPVFLLSGRRASATKYANGEMREFYRREHQARELKGESLRAFVRTGVNRAGETQRFLAPGLTVILLVVAATSQRRRSLILPFAGTLLVLGGALSVTWFSLHYLAPVIACWAIILTAGLERLATLEPPPGRTGILMASLILGGAAVSALFTPLRLRDERPMRRASWHGQRDSIARSLKATGRKHLVLVSYGAKHSPFQEWVHNDASLSETPVLWARSLRPDKDALLMDHFRDRVTWGVHVEDGRGPFRLQPIGDSAHAKLANQ